MKTLPFLALGFICSMTICVACTALPPLVEAEIARSKPGTITVVEFVDYRCHFCRGLQGILGPLLQERQGQVRLVVKHVPLEKHPGARRAAEVAICAEEQGKLAAVHDALIAGDGADDQSTLDLAQRAGVDVEAFKACLRSDVPKARILQDEADFQSVGADGLPLVFIQRQKFVGLVTADSLDRALREATP